MYFFLYSLSSYFFLRLYVSLHSVSAHAQVIEKTRSYSHTEWNFLSSPSVNGGKICKQNAVKLDSKLNVSLQHCSAFFIAALSHFFHCSIVPLFSLQHCLDFFIAALSRFFHCCIVPLLSWEHSEAFVFAVFAHFCHCSIVPLLSLLCWPASVFAALSHFCHCSRRCVPLETMSRFCPCRRGCDSLATLSSVVPTGGGVVP